MHIVGRQVVLADRLGKAVLAVRVVDQPPSELLEDAVAAVPDDVELVSLGDLEDPPHRAAAGSVRPDELPPSRIERLKASREATVEELLVVVQVECVEINARAAVRLLDPEHLATFHWDRFPGETWRGVPDRADGRRHVRNT